MIGYCNGFHDASKVILERFPNYHDALSVEEIHGDLDPEVFSNDHVRLNRPFVARGAAREWKACHGWKMAHLKQALGNVNDLFQSPGSIEITRPMREYAGTPYGAERAARRAATPRNLSALAFLERLESGENAAAYGVSLGTPGLDGLKANTGSLSFVDAPWEARGTYESALFIYRGGYTDWHFHLFDVAVAVQLIGRKEFLLLPPDRRTFDAMWSVVATRGVWEIDPADYPDLGQLRPYRVVLEPSDALYIPLFWWHAVEPCDDEAGSNMAFFLHPPRGAQYDLRFPAARFNLRLATDHSRFRGKLPRLCLEAFGAFMRHPWRPPYLSRYDAAGPKAR